MLILNKTSKKRLKTEILFLSWALIICAVSESRAEGQNEATLAPSSVPNVALRPVRVELSVVLKSGLTGLSATPHRKAVRKQAREFLEVHRLFRQAAAADKKVPAPAVIAWQSRCLSDPKSNPFCSAVDEMVSSSAEIKDEAGEENGSPTVTQDSKQISRLLSEGELAALRGVDERLLHRSARQLSEWSLLEKVSSKALESSGCQDSTLNLVLGHKAEEFFPEKRFQDLAVAHYKRAAQCEGPNDQSAKAQYRLSLLLIWEGKCAQASDWLTKLYSAKESFYASRALFWKARCAKQSGDKLAQDAFRSRLTKEFPLNFHELILREGKLLTPPQSLDVRPALVQFREDEGAFPGAFKINQKITSAETLQEVGAHALALDFLEALAADSASSSPELRLYIAVLMQRSGDSIGQFKALSRLFRDSPAMISRATLELFYPLKRNHADIIKRFGSRVDPWLVAALIRQESGFNTNARSPAGAMGVMQLMPATARRMEKVSKRELFDMKTNVRLGVKYFDQLLVRFEGDAELALAAYNAGPEKVDQWKRRYVTDDRVLFLDLIPYRETREYVAYIARNYYWYLSLYAGHVLEERVQLRAPRAPASSTATREAGKKPLVFSLFGTL